MPLVDPALEWISSKLYPNGRPTPERARTDFAGDDPLLAYIAAKLHPAAEPTTQPTEVAADDEVVLSTYELEAWATRLDDAQRAGCRRGNKACNDQWIAAAAELEAEAADES